MTERFCFELVQLTDKPFDEDEVNTNEDTEYEEENFNHSSERYVPEEILCHLLSKVAAPESPTKGESDEAPVDSPQHVPNQIDITSSIETPPSDVLSLMAEKAKKSELEHRKRVQRYREHQKQLEKEKQSELVKRKHKKISLFAKKKTLLSEQDKLAFALEQSRASNVLELVSHSFVSINADDVRCSFVFSLPIGLREWKYPCTAPLELSVPSVTPNPLDPIDWFLKSPVELYCVCTLQGSTTYRFIIHKELRAMVLHGKRSVAINESVTLTHFTKPIQVISYWPKKMTVPPRFCIAISFSQEPDISDFLSHLRCIAESKEVSCRAATEEEYDTYRSYSKAAGLELFPDMGNTIVPFIMNAESEDLDYDSKITISLSSGWLPRQGDLVSVQEYHPFIELLVGSPLHANLCNETMTNFSIQFNHNVFNKEEHPVAFLNYVQIEPTPHSGSWKVKNPTTISFSCPLHQKAFIGSVRYKVTILEGFVSSLNPQYPLERTVYLEFTHRISILRSIPSRGMVQGTTVPLFLQWNQRVEKESVFQRVKLYEKRRIKADKLVPLRFAKPGEKLFSANIANAIRQLGEDYFVLLYPQDKLKHNATYQWILEAGVHSLEGPEPSLSTFQTKFSTESPFRADLEFISKVKGRIQTSVPIASLHIEIEPPQPNNDWYTLDPNKKFIYLNLLSLPRNTEYRIWFSQTNYTILESGDPVIEPWDHTVTGIMNLLTSVDTVQGDNGTISPFPQFVLCFTYAVTAKQIEAVSSINGSTLECVDQDRWFPMTSHIIDQYHNTRQHVIVLQPTEALPYHTNVVVRLENIPSSEGPLVGPSHEVKFLTSPKFCVITKSGPIEQKKRMLIEFNQSLIALGSTAPFQVVERNSKTIRDEYQPIMDPAVKGEWKICSTDPSCKTIEFVAEEPLLLATDYSISIPAGFASQNGTCLTSEYVLHLHTSVPHVLSHYPVYSQTYVSCKAMFMLRFNVPVYPEQVASLCSLQLPQGESHELEVASEEQIEKYSDLHRERNKLSAAENYMVCLVCSTTLPVSITGEFHLKAGVISMEGPLPSISPYKFKFKTDKGFSVTRIHIIQKDEGDRVEILFSQSIRDSQLILPHIHPPIPGEWLIGKDSLSLTATKRIANATEYMVTIPKGIISGDGSLLRVDVSKSVCSLRPEASLILPKEHKAQGASPQILLRFNQPVDLKSVVKRVHVKYKGTILSTTISCRLATEEDLELFPELQQNDVPLMLTKQLPTNTSFSIILKEGITSLEGKLTSKQIASWPFQTTTEIPYSSTDLAIVGIRAPHPFFEGDTIVVVFSSTISHSSLVSISHSSEYSLQIDILGRKIKITLSSNSKQKFRVDNDIKIDLSNVRTISRAALPRKEALIPLRIHAHTFTSGLYAFEDGFITRPADMKNYTFSCRSYNYKELRVCISQLKPSRDISKWKQWKYKPNSSDIVACGKKLYDKVVQVANFEENQQVLFTVDLSHVMEIVGSSLAHIGIVISPTVRANYPNPEEYVVPIRAWIQFTDIGMELFGDCGGMWAWCTDLRHKIGPLEHTKLSVLHSNGTMIAKKLHTDSQGLVRISNMKISNYYTVIARRNDDCAFLDSIEQRDYTLARIPEESLLWHIVSDRGCYNPTEVLVLQGYIRRRTLAPHANYEHLSIPANISLSCEIYDSLHEILFKLDEISLTKFGSFSVQVNVPKLCNLGIAEAIFYAKEMSISGRKELQRDVGQQSAFFQIQECKPSILQLTSTILTNDLVFYHGNALLQGQACYYAGGSLSNTEVVWKVIASRSNQSQLFGTHAFSSFHFAGLSTGELYADSLHAFTNDVGETLVEIKFHGDMDTRVPISVEASLEIIDDVDKGEPSFVSFTVFPAPFIVGVFSPQYPRVNNHLASSFEVQFIVLDCKSLQPLAGISTRLYIQKKFSSLSSSTETLHLVSQEKPVSATVNWDRLVSEILVTAEAYQDDTMSSCAELLIKIDNHYVKPPASRIEPQNDVEQLYAEKELAVSFAKHTWPDENNQFPVHSNVCIKFLAKACNNVSVGLIREYCNGISSIRCLSSAERVGEDIETSCVLFTEAKHVPDLLTKAVIHGVDQSGKRTTWNASCSLTVSSDIHSLLVQVHVDRTIIEPGGAANAEISVYDLLSHKALTNAEVALFIVDEATLDLLKYSPFQQDIIQSFYPRRSLVYQSEVLHSYSNRDKIQQVLVDTKPGHPNDLYGYPGTRMVENLPKIKDVRMKQTIGEPIMLELLDTAGTEQFAAMRDLYMKNGDAFVLVYSIVARSTFNDIPDFFEQICRVKDSDFVDCVLVGNKDDLDDERVVTEDEGASLAKKLNALFYETSAKVNHNVTDMFHDVAEQVGRGGSLKIVVLGSGGVGKSALCCQYVQGIFVEKYDPTIEDSYRKAVDFGQAAQRDNRGPSKPKKRTNNEKNPLPAPPIEENENILHTVDSIQVRKDFNPLAHYTACAATNQLGHCTIPFVVPDSLTRFRIFAIATHEHQFGTNESAITVQLPLTIRTNAPPFMLVSDRSCLSFKVQNATTESLHGFVVVRTCDEAIQLVDHQCNAYGVEFTLAAHCSSSFSASVEAVKKGRGLIQVICVTGSYTDAIEIPIPVKPLVPSIDPTIEVKGNFPALPSPVVISLPIPLTLQNQQELDHIEIIIHGSSQTMLTSIGAYVYLYEAKTFEENASQLIVLCKLASLLAQTTHESMKYCSWWWNFTSYYSYTYYKPYSRYSSVLNSLYSLPTCDIFSLCHFIHAITLLSKSEVKSVKKRRQTSEMLSRLQNFVLQAPSPVTGHDKHYALYCYALFSLVEWFSVSGSNKQKKTYQKAARGFLKNISLDGLPLECLGWLLSALRDDNTVVQYLTEYLEQHVEYDGEIGFFYTFYYPDTCQALYHSSLRSNGVILNGLLDAGVHSALVDGLAGYLSHVGTNLKEQPLQDRCWSVLSLQKFYTRESEKQQQNASSCVTAWVNHQFLASHSLSNTQRELFTCSKENLNASLDSLLEANVILMKEGSLKVSYQLLATHNVVHYPLAAVSSRGIHVTRNYALHESNFDHGLLSSSGTQPWKVKLHQRVVVTITMAIFNSCDKVLLVDYLPGGLRAENALIHKLPETATIPVESDVAKSYNTPPSAVSHLPEEILLFIFRYLEDTDVVRVGQVCKRWKRLAEDDELWSELLYMITNQKQSSIRNKLRVKPWWMSAKEFYLIQCDRVEYDQVKSSREKQRDSLVTGSDWVSHQNIREDRVECLAEQLATGTYIYQYIAKAISPGEYTIPPATATYLLNPDIRGSSTSDSISIHN